MRDDRFGDRFEVELREALRLELAGVAVGVGAPQIRGRIAARQRTRRITQLGLAAAALGLAIVGGLVLAGRVITTPTGAEPATVAAIEVASGDLVLSRAWPDGRTEEAARYPGGLDLLRAVPGHTNATGLPRDTVATAGPDGRLAIALPGGEILYFSGSSRERGAAPAGAIADGSATMSFGWAPDGRLVRVVGQYVRLLDPETGNETAGALPPEAVPDWTRGPTYLLIWTGDGKVLATRGDPTTFDAEIGSLDLTTDEPTFIPGLPASVRADTGTELRYAADGSWPGGGCMDTDRLTRCAGLADWTSGESAPVAAWYVTRADEALDPAPIRTADGTGLLAVTRGIGADRGRVLVIDAPGSWREALAFDAPAFDTGNWESYWEAATYPVGVAPGGRSIALKMPAALLVGDLETGEHMTLPAGTVFVGWPTAPVVETDGLATLAACEPATPEDAAAVAMSASGTLSPASAGAKPVVGERQDADPFRRDELAGAPAVEAQADGLLTLALPAGACVEATMVEVVLTDPAADATSVTLGARSAGNGTVGGLVSVTAPPLGDWVVRIKLWLAGADREAILLYHVATTGASKLVVTPEP